VASFVPGSGSANKRALIDALLAEGHDVTEWNDEPSAVYPEHVHLHDEVRVVLTGEMTIRTADRSFVLKPGDRIDIEAGEEHAASVGDAGVTYIAGSKRSDD
jgi:quercetin dioxygenase-like cupin family protein